MSILIGLVALAIGAFIGFAVGRASGRASGRLEGASETEQEVRAVLEDVGRGRLPSGGTGTLAADLRSALGRGWAPRDAERRAALKEAVGRVSAFLDRQVREPLRGAGPTADADELRERIEHALGALEDIDFFVTEARIERRGTDLVQLVQKLSREFTADQGIAVRLHLGAPAIRAQVAAEPLKDALYLLLHNAARFGGGTTIDLVLVEERGSPRILVRDRGEGFSAEAFERAFDPFYSTSPEGLGLGLPHARRVIEAMGGRLELRNVPDGGAEVEVTLS